MNKSDNATASVEVSQTRDRLADLMAAIVKEMTSSEEISVTYSAGDKTTVYNIHLPPQFRGKLIGSQGRTILALRNILSAMAGNHGFRAIIELVV
ncbi:MAG: KH domain-containing protein [Bacillota bacterium]